MNIDITAKNFDLTPSIKEFVAERTEKLNKFFDKITEARITLEVDDGHHKHGKINKCGALLRVPGQKDVYVEEWSEDMHKSINRAMLAVEKELKKLKQKFQGRDYKKVREIKERGFGE